VIWSMLLLLLLLFCLIELLVKGDRFTMQILFTISQMFGGSKRPQQLAAQSRTAFWLTIMLIVALSLVIFVEAWFLNIVLLAYASLKGKGRQRQLLDRNNWNPSAEVRTTLVPPTITKHYDPSSFLQPPHQKQKNISRTLQNLWK